MAIRLSGRVMVFWRDKIIRVEASSVPRFLWATASIDVFLGEQCILRTGGQPALKGSYSTVFQDGGTEHQAELSWGYIRQHQFPYKLHIDGALIVESQVFVRNWQLGFIPVLIITALLFSLIQLIMRL